MEGHGLAFPGNRGQGGHPGGISPEMKRRVRRQRQEAKADDRAELIEAQLRLQALEYQLRLIQLKRDVRDMRRANGS